MFDYIACEIPLPRLESKEGEKLVVHIPYKADHQYQTKDLDNALVEYKIGKDRVLYQKKVEYEERELTEEEKEDKDSGAFWSPMWCMEEKSHEWVRDNFTGYIRFYDILYDVDSSHDAWVDYRVHVRNGQVQGAVELETYRLEDNTENKTNQIKWKEQAKARKEYEEKWRYKYFGKYWNRVVRFKFRILHKIFNWAYNASTNLWKLERKITF